MKKCGFQNHHTGHRFQDEDSLIKACPGLEPATTVPEAVDRLREWAEVETLPAQDEFDDILADLTRLVG